MHGLPPRSVLPQTNWLVSSTRPANYKQSTATTLMELASGRPREVVSQAAEPRALPIHSAPDPHPEADWAYTSLTASTA